MSKYTKYRLYQKYETRGSQEAIPVYPNTFSIDGDGTMPLVIVEENSRDCGYTGDTQPIYRWYNMPIDKYYVCDACQDYENHYLTLVARGSGSIKKVRHSGTFQYSKDEGYTWVNATSATTISVNNGDRVMFKGNLTPMGQNLWGVGRFSASTQFEAEGNPMSLLYGDNFIGQTSVGEKSFAFAEMFSGCTTLTSIDNLKLVATTLSDHCYYCMFMNCTSLTSVPSNLLPATTLADWCYSSMFYGCSSLATAPDLSATTLEDYCYNQIFKDCTSLNYIKCLATDISATYCLGYWVYNVSSSGTFVRASNANWPCESVRSVNTVPSGWDIVPPCPSYSNQYLTLVARGSGAFNISRYDTTQYQYSKDNGVTWTDATIQTNISVSNGDRVMFKGTITPAYYYGVGAFSASTQFEAEGNPMSLLYGDNFIGQTSLSGKIYAFKTMFSSCTGLTSIDNLVLPATTLSMCCYEDMFFGCTSLTSIPSGLLPATELVRECYYSMFRGCTSLSSVPSNLLPSTTLAYYCYSRMFSGCTSLTTAPELIAPTLFEHCYDNMFYGCSRLNYVKCLATNISATDCTLNWLYNVSSSGTFVKNSSMSGWPSGVDGIPTNWTVQNA